MRSLIAPVSSAIATSSSRSPWHSPVSYLFGGLAAMTGLIAFALLILACSYCQLARSEDEQTRRRQADVEQGKTAEGDINKVSPVFEDKLLVIMAGNHIPTFLATPRFSKASLLAPVVFSNSATKEEQTTKEEETEQVQTSSRRDDQTEL